MKIDIEHCYRCGRSFNEMGVDRDHFDTDSCYDCVQAIRRQCEAVLRHIPMPTAMAADDIIVRANGVSDEDWGMVQNQWEDQLAETDIMEEGQR